MSVRVGQLGDVAEFIRGVTYKPHNVMETKSSGSIVCMRTKNVQKQLDERDLLSIPTELVKKKSKILRKGDLLVSTANSWNLVGKCCWVPDLGYEATAGGFIAILRANTKELDERYLYHWFSSGRTQHKARNCGRQTTNISNMDIGRCLKLEIPLPPLPEQRRIAAILDKADALRQKRQAAIARLDDLLQSVFLDMFGDPAKNAMDLPTSTVGDIALQVTDGAHHTPKRETSGIPLLSARNVLMGQLDFSNTDFIGEAEHERLSKRCSPAKGDILISCSGSIGRVAQIRTDISFSLVRSAALLKLNKDIVVPDFLEYQLRTPYLQELMRRGAKSSSQANLFQGPIKTLPVIIPSLPEQEHFSLLVGQINGKSGAMMKSSQQLDHLFMSVQQRAFAGTL